MVKMSGCVPDLPDHRDRVLDLLPPKKRDLPAKGDIRIADNFPHLEPGPSRELHSERHRRCVPPLRHGQGGAQGLHPVEALCLLQRAREEGHADTDSGSQIRDGIKSVAQLGVCDEKLRTYDTERFTEKPPSAAYEAAANCSVKENARVEQTFDDQNACISAGFPFAFGLIVFTSFISDEGENMGSMKMPEMYD